MSAFNSPLLRASFSVLTGINQQWIMEQVSLTIVPVTRLTELTLGLSASVAEVCPGVGLKASDLRPTAEGKYICYLTFDVAAMRARRKKVDCTLLFEDNADIPTQSMLIYTPQRMVGRVELEVIFLADHRPPLVCGVQWGNEYPHPDSVIFAQQIQLEQVKPNGSEQTFASARFTTKNVPSDCTLGIVW